MFQPAIVERLGYDLADRRQHSILASQFVACGATICRLEHTFEVAPRHFVIADAPALRDFLDHGLGMLGLELLMIPGEYVPAPRSYAHTSELQSLLPPSYYAFLLTHQLTL